MKSSEIRQKFFEFFQSKQHEIVTSAPIVLKDDPTLMFTNAGMNQFKDYFLGYKEAKFPRVADTQKCLRVSGKHNDLEEVGHDTYHHTMFEMLGNWSFGNYFKKEAIAWAWELLTEIYKIPKEDLYVSIFKGDVNDKLLRDSEAFDIWKQYIAEDRILEFDKKDNFWEMGDTGPCGPCSEIHVDCRSAEEKEKIAGKDLVNHDHPQVVEIWNLVFMEFLRKADGSLEKLPAQHVDTGMGFERLCMALQKKQSNYDTDVFQPLIQKIEKITQKVYGKNEKIDIAIRVIADHIRAVAFSIADGQLPSNTGAGYVIRRILRRAISYGFRFLGQKEAFIYRLITVLEEELGTVFPEIISQKELVQNVIKEEEISFLRTLEQGLNRMEQIITENQQKNQKCIDGKIIFELYDTYGFPIDLSALVAQNYGMTIDEVGFEKYMTIQKNRAREASASETGDWVVLFEDAAAEFIGYDYTETKVKLTKYRSIKNNKGTFYQLVFNITPFYAESGGQVGDTGYLVFGDERISILDTKKENNLIVHFSQQLPQNLRAEFLAVVHKERRKAITQNHSATHLLHQALREVLGTHVAQRGSFVGPDYLRFDFSHFAKVSHEELQQIEEIIFKNIIASYPLEEHRQVPIQLAIDKGAMALFGEKYDDLVRTIKFGESIELCGGCHVQNTAEIMMFHFITESSVAAGIRRIEAVTGQKAIDALKESFMNYRALLQVLKSPKDPLQAITQIQQENSDLRKQIEKMQLEKAAAVRKEWLTKIAKKDDISFLIQQTDLNIDQIKNIIFQLKEQVENLFLVLVSTYQDKPAISVYISESLVETKNLDASKIVRELAQNINGGGGGQKFFATAGGKDLSGVHKVLTQAITYIS